MLQPQPNDGFEWTQAPWGFVLRCRPLSDVADHFFTGGDLRLGSDEREWEAVAHEIGVDPAHLLLIRQVHRADAAIVRSGRTGSWERPQADVIVSDDHTSAIAVRVADCVPILLADTRRRVVGAVHAGWRGTVQRAAMAGVRAMQTSFGSNPADLVAAIGPCLGRCCGEVGPEVVQAFREANHHADSIRRWFEAGTSGRPHIDLELANRDQLEECGVRADRIHASGLCTQSNAGVLHSYRADKDGSGRMAAVIRP
jgi:YfiH family protein